MSQLFCVLLLYVCVHIYIYTQNIFHDLTELSCLSNLSLKGDATGHGPEAYEAITLLVKDSLTPLPASRTAFRAFGSSVTFMSCAGRQLFRSLHDVSESDFNEDAIRIYEAQSRVCRVCRVQFASC